MKYLFDKFVVDSERFELTLGGDVIKLQPRALNLLIKVLEYDGRMLSKHQIWETVWSGREVSESALSSQVWALRKALGDDKKPHRIIGTVHGQGFRMLAEVTRETAVLSASPASTSPRQESQPTGLPPKVAVLSFEAASDISEQVQLAKALPADILYSLAKLRWLRVIARASSFALGDGHDAVSRVKSEVDGDYAITGRVAAQGRGFEVAVELIDTSDLTAIWGDRFQISHDEVHVLRDNIVNEIIQRVDVMLSEREAERARLKQPDSMSAWELFHLGQSEIIGRLHADYDAALRYFGKAVELEKSFARAHAGIARAQIARIFNAGHSDIDNALSIAAEEAAMAVELDRFDPFTNLMLSQSRRMNHDLGAGRIFGERAIELAPSYAEAHYMMSGIELFDGQYETALKYSEQAYDLDPRNPLGFEVQIHRAFAAMHLSDIESARDAAKRIASDPAGRLSPYAMGAAITALHHVGLADEAKEAATQSQGIDFDLSQIPMERVFPPSASATVEAIMSAMMVHRPDLFQLRG